MTTNDLSGKLDAIREECTRIAPRLYGPVYHLALQVALLAEVLGSLVREGREDADEGMAKKSDWQGDDVVI